MKLLFIRHGFTAGNLEKRYIGRTDEPLCQEGIRRLHEIQYPRCEVLISSPMQRCIETAKLIYPGQSAIVCNDFRECDFGDFEGRNYLELNGDAAYQAWIDSGGNMPFPNGESPAAFRKRSCTAFLGMIAAYSQSESIAMVVHGGTIMSVMERFAEPPQDYYAWMTENGHGWCGTYIQNKIMEPERI